jgi:2-polyprenyl-3-methyl-5-hydroxy-6-metoxy-1,4-benzoquinol methylase/prefoldin subunit 5
MADTLPRPAPIPPPDRRQIDRLNTFWNIFDDTSQPAPSMRARVAVAARRLLRRILLRQQEFNSTVVDHLNRNVEVAEQAHVASIGLIRWVEDTMDPAVGRLDSAVDELRRYQHALGARERRSEAAVASLAASHEELRASVGVLQQAAQTLKREIARLAEQGVPQAAAAGAPAAAAAPAGQLAALDSHTYVGFEDQFRGSQDDIRGRVAEYLPIFEGASDVLDVGCGRGEFLSLLRERGIRARGIDVNGAMVDVCREQGLDAEEADALAYLRSQADGSLGGLFAAQVIEHLEPRYLTALLDAAFQKLRPGAPIVLETINPACWFAFFESYIRDITHVRAIHPDTLKYLLVAGGFQHVDIRYRAPYPERDKLQPIPPQATLGDSVETLNANVERLNRLLFTWLDYAAIGRRP